MNRKLTSYKTTETLPLRVPQTAKKKTRRIYTKTTKHRTQRDRGFTSSRGFSFHLTGLTGSTEHQTLANNTSISRRAKNKTGYREEAAKGDRNSRDSYLSERASARARLCIEIYESQERRLRHAGCRKRKESNKQIESRPKLLRLNLVRAMLKDEGRRDFRGGFRADVSGSNVDFST